MKYVLIFSLLIFPKFLFAKTLATYEKLNITQEEAEFKAKTLGIQNYFSLPKDSQNKILTQLLKEKAIEAEAETFKKEILSGKSKWKESFAKIASEKSIDTSTASKGGFVGTVLETFLPPDLIKELSKLKPNTLSNPIKTNLGYHLVYIEKTEDAAIPPLEQAKPALLNQILTAKKEDIASKLIDEKKIKFNQL